MCRTLLNLTDFCSSPITSVDNRAVYSFHDRSVLQEASTLELHHDFPNEPDTFKVCFRSDS
jgi:hypothetical protein